MVQVVAGLDSIRVEISLWVLQEGENGDVVAASSPCQLDLSLGASLVLWYDVRLDLHLLLAKVRYHREGRLDPADGSKAGSSLRFLVDDAPPSSVWRPPEVASAPAVPERPFDL